METKGNSRCLFCRKAYSLKGRDKCKAVSDIFIFLCKLFNLSSPHYHQKRNNFASLSSYDLCGKCSALIQTAVSTYNQIQLLQNNLESIKCNLRDLFSISNDYSNNSNERLDTKKSFRQLFANSWNTELMESCMNFTVNAETQTGDGREKESKNILVAFAADGTMVEASAELMELSDSISIPSARSLSDEGSDRCDETSVEGSKWIGHQFYDPDAASKDSSSSGDSFSRTMLSKRAQTSGRKSFTCCFCSEGFTLVKNLNRHVFKMHGRRAVVYCPLCGLDFSNEQTGAINDDYPYVCRLSDCKRRFQTIAELRSHHLIKCAEYAEVNENAVTVYSSVSNVLPHASCSSPKKREFLNRQDWKSSSRDEITKESCEQIDMESKDCQILQSVNKGVTVSSSKLLQSTLHNSDLAGAFKCFHCPKMFLTDHGRRQHAKVHKDVKPLSCAICYEGFTMLCNLRRHVLKAHFRASQFSCPLCGLDFTHDPLSGTFQDDSAFVCSLPGCSRTSHTPQDLQSHHLAECPEILKLKGLTPR